MQRHTELDSTQAFADGRVGIRVLKRLTHNRIELFAEQHYHEIAAGAEVEESLVRLEEGLSGMGWPMISAEEVGRVLAVAAVARSNEVKDDG